MRDSPCLHAADRRTHRRRAFALWVALVGAASVCAGPLADPTRPPMLPAMAASTTGTHGAVSTRPTAEPRVAPQLQSVQVPESGLASAVVDGRLVQVGDRIGGAVIASIDKQGLTLRPAMGSGTGGHERLWLLASGAKQPAGTLAESRTARYAPTAAPAASAPLAQAMNDELPRQSTQARADTPARTVSLVGKATP